MSNQESVTEVNNQITNEVNTEPGNTFTKPEFFRASEVKDVVDDGHPESPMEHIDNELRKLNVPEDKLQGWKRGYFQTEEEIDAYNKAVKGTVTVKKTTTDEVDTKDLTDTSKYEGK